MRLFYELIQVAIGSNNSLSYIPQVEEWENLFYQAKKQALIGIAFHGVQQLYKVHPEQTANLSIKLKMTWIGLTAKIEDRNRLLNRRASEITQFFNDGGLRCCVLKGQGVAELYGNLKALRQPGDIDLWVEGKRENVIAFMKNKGWKVGTSVVHHTDVEIFDDVDTEIHHYPSYTYSPFRWLRYRRWFKEQAKIQFQLFDESLGFNYPSVRFNLVYSMLHIFRHVFHEGIGLKQLLDYYCILTHASERDRIIATATLKHLGLFDFAAAVMFVEKEFLEIEDRFLLCAPSKRFGRFLLDEINKAGNFGKYDARVIEAHSGNSMKLYFHNVKRIFRLLRYFPSEVLWAPVWKPVHWAWRKLI